MLKKVLIIDDSRLIHQMYKMSLMRYPCVILNALNGEEGFKKLEENPDVGLVLLDINMPVMNGIEFIQKIKSMPAYSHIPVIMVSTEGKDDDARRALALGAAGYVKKPFQPSELQALIEALPAATQGPR